MCRCKERGAAIVRGVKSAAAGDLKQTGVELKFVAKSAAEDAASAFRQKIAPAKSRLMRR
jgi:hypothetical protein